VCHGERGQKARIDTAACVNLVGVSHYGRAIQTLSRTAYVSTTIHKNNPFVSYSTAMQGQSSPGPDPDKLQAAPHKKKERKKRRGMERAGCRQKERPGVVWKARLRTYRSANMTVCPTTQC
jgi:hypothetical protein